MNIRMKRKLGILLPIFSLVIHLNLAEEKLSLVQVLFRHGDREAETVQGVEEHGPLTNLGKKQMHDLGVFLRKRYPDLIQNEFKPTETFILSSDKDRTIDSASLVAHGLYTNCNDHNKLNGSFPIVSYCPIPVRRIPKEIDRFIQLSYKCPRHSELTDEVLAIEFGPDFLDAMGTFLQRFALETGNYKPFNTSLGYFERIYDVGVFEEKPRFNASHNLPVEEWAKEFLTNDRLISLKTDLLQKMLNTREMQRLYAGSMLGLFLENFQNQDKAKTLTLYSGHDRILYVIMVTLGVWDLNEKEMPPVGSALIFEMYGEDPKHLQLWYRQGTSEEAKPLEIPNCGFKCSFSTFQELFGDLVPTDYEMECNLAE